ncbi:MAG: hypothetical protein VX871_06590, partial [Pseudomonadota bacterium]|nr:hypothetical protein [Pseudomonadota bacterium]
MSRIGLLFTGGLLAVALAGVSIPPAHAGKTCYGSTGKAGWFAEKYAGEASVRRLNHAIDAEANKRKWKTVYVTKVKTTCAKGDLGFYTCTSAANACSSK